MNSLSIFWLYICIFSIFLTNTFYINIGFYLKPYMICGFFIFFSKGLRFKFAKIHNLEILLFIWFVYILLNSLVAYDYSVSLRYIFGIMLISFSIVNYKQEILEYDKIKFEKIICNVGILYGIVSLIYYFTGLISLKFNFHGNNIIRYGVLLDRNFPRLISFANSDPNITVIYISFFLSFFYKYINKGKIYFCGAFIYFILILLTISRSAYIVLVSLIIIGNFVQKNIIKNIIYICYIFLSCSCFFILSNYLNNNFNFNNFIKERFEKIGDDGGSGRLYLWENALETFKNHPILGIGINNTIAYGKNITHKTTHYAHNTLLDVVSELGLLGLYLYLLVLIYVLYLNYKIRKSSFLLYFNISLLIQSMFVSVLINEMWFLLFMLTSVYTNDYKYSLGEE